MTPREVIKAWLRSVNPNNRPLNEEDCAEDFLARLKSNGLFIGPVVATRPMFNAVRAYQPERVKALDYDAFKVIWAMARAEWRRGDGG